MHELKKASPSSDLLLSYACKFVLPASSPLAPPLLFSRQIRSPSLILSRAISFPALQCVDLRQHPQASGGGGISKRAAHGVGKWRAVTTVDAALERCLRHHATSRRPPANPLCPPVLRDHLGWRGGFFNKALFGCSRIRINPHVLGWIGLELELNFTTIHYNTCGLR